MKIDGLTQEQVEMLDKLWSIDTVEELQEFRSSLPTFRRQQVDTLTEMLIQESLEEDIVRMTRYPDAENLIARAKRG